MLDCRPSKFPKKDEKGRVDVLCANYRCCIEGETVQGSYSKGGDLTGEIAVVVDEFEERGIEADPSAVKAAIKRGFEEERKRVDSFANEIWAKHHKDLVGAIRLAKIYPKNISQVIPEGSRQMLALMLYRQPCNEATMEERKSDLEKALEGFVFQGSMEATCYGPVSNPSDIFDGRTEEASAARGATD